MNSIGEELRAFGEALPEIASTMGLIFNTPTTIGAYKQGSLGLAIPLTLLEMVFAYGVYKGVLRGDLFYRWTRRNDCPDPLKILYNKVRSKIYAML